MNTSRNETIGLVLSIAKLLAFAVFAATYNLPLPVRAQNNVVGSWTNPVDIQVEGVHGAVLPNGKVLYLPHREDPFTGQTTSVVFDPNNPAGANYVTAPRNYFCGGQSMLADGRLLFNGGDYDALNSSGYFDYLTETWTIDANTNRPRWYPSTIQLGDGTVWTFGGQNSPAEVETNDPTIEFYNPMSSAWTMAGGQGIPGQYVEAYNRLHLLPDGRVFQSGHIPDTYLYDPIARTWEFVDSTNHGLARGDGSSVRLQDGRILIVGGHQEIGKEFTEPTATAEIIDLDQPNPMWQNVASMSRGRSFVNTVLLPDGNVFVVGGGEPQDVVPELFNPNTNTWTNMAAHDIIRGYHSTALLLPDARVITSGGAGADGPGLFKESSEIEIWSPYYLFSTPRPVINNLVTAANYGQQVVMSYSSSVPVSHVVIHRSGEQTHAFSYNQVSERVDLDSNNSSSLTFTVPSNPNILPPCYYMIFLMSEDGVPSVAQWMQIGNDVAKTMLGDVNMDGVVNLLDVQPFVNLIANGQFQTEADINQDGLVNLLDVTPFVAILSS